MTICQSGFVYSFQAQDFPGALPVGADHRSAEGWRCAGDRYAAGASNVSRAKSYPRVRVDYASPRDVFITVKPTLLVEAMPASTTPYKLSIDALRGISRIVSVNTNFSGAPTPLT